MNISSFLYRRLARWVTCEFKLSGNSKLALTNKYEIASFKDVFCHPFYWQVFHWLEEVPKLVVDCGAHCGHFSILTDACVKSKFSDVNTRYILVEPNPYLIPIIQQNLRNADIDKRGFVKQGILGSRSGKGTLWVNPKNFLETSLQHNQSCKPHEISYFDLSSVVGEQMIDLMKIDIEGGEFEFVKENLGILKQTKLVFMELHQASDELHSQLFEQMKSVGLHLATPPISAHGQQLIIFNQSSF